MGNLSGQQVRGLLECVRALYRAPDLPAFRRAVVRTLPAVVRGRSVSYNEVDLARRQAHALFDTDEWDAEALAATLSRVQDRHPLIQRFVRHGDGQALAISDLLSADEYFGGPVYNELYGPLGLRDQMSIGVSIGPSLLLGVVVNRTRRGFSETDRLLMNLLRPHLEQAYHQARLNEEVGRTVRGLEMALAHSGRAVVRVDARGRTHDVTPLAREWLARFFPDVSREGRLPVTVEQWLGQLEAGGAEGGPPPVRLPLVAERGGEHLEIRRLRPPASAGDGEGPEGSGGSGSLLLLEHRAPPRGPAPLRRLGLTARQSEILYWLAQGKTNPEIGVILGISKRTAQKHVEIIFEKLDVTTRTAAALKADEALRAAVRSDGG